MAQLQLTSAPPKTHANSMMAALLNPLVVHVHIPREAPRFDRRDGDDATHVTGSVSDMSNSGASSAKRSRSAETPEKRKRNRKPTYAIRKEERDMLLQQAHDLEAHIEFLRRQVGMPSISEYNLLQRSMLDQRKMQEARRHRAVVLCGARSMLSKRLREEFASPLKMHIHLGRRADERRATLRNLRGPKLDAAYEFLQQQTIGVDRSVPWQQSETWTSPSGDLCMMHSDITHFDGATSVKQVYDALIFYVENIEISISEELGHLTLREDGDCVDTSAVNNRLVSSTNYGVVVESNTVVFGEYHERCPRHHGQEYAMLSNDYVDEDELHPYLPHERVRKNITAALEVCKVTRPGSDTPVVAMFRSAFLSIHQSQFPISAEALDDLCATSRNWGHVMVKVIRDRIASHAGTGSLN